MFTGSQKKMYPFVFALAGVRKTEARRRWCFFCTNDGN